MGDVLVPEVLLNGPGILAVARQRGPLGASVQFEALSALCGISVHLSRTGLNGDHPAVSR